MGKALLMLAMAFPLLAADLPQPPLLVAQPAASPERVHSLVEASDVIVIARIIMAPEFLSGSAPIVSPTPQRYYSEGIVRLRIEKTLKGTAEKFSSPLITVRFPMFSCPATPSSQGIDQALRSYETGTKMIFFLHDRRLRPELGSAGLNDESIDFVGFDPDMSCQLYREELLEAIQRVILGGSKPYLYTVELVRGTKTEKGLRLALNIRKSGEAYNSGEMLITPKNPFFATFEKALARLDKEEIFYALDSNAEIAPGRTLSALGRGKNSHLGLYTEFRDYPAESLKHIPAIPMGGSRFPESAIVSLKEISENEYLGISPRIVKP